MKVLVYKCPFTGDLFELKDREKYAMHLREIRKKMSLRREKNRILKNWKDWLLAEREKIHRVEDIPAWFIANQRYIMDACNAIAFGGDFRRRERFVDEDKFVKLEWQHIRYRKNTSNSHVCPADGVTNWGAQEKDKPTGYPGWKGYLNGSLVRPKYKDYDYPYSEALNLVGIRTGSGGGGNSNFGFEFTIFLSDWPGLQEEVRLMEQNEIVGILRGQK